MDEIKPRLDRLRSVTRRAINVSRGDLVRMGPLRSGQELPLLIEPWEGRLDLRAWLEGNADHLRDLLIRHGAILFRSFRVGSVEDFEGCVRALSPEALEYTYRSTPRTEIAGRIYSSTEYPSDQHIPMHNEMSYTRTWPMKIWFHCMVAAETGGETPIADSRRVFQRIDPSLRENFAAKNVTYVRNYGDGMDLPWQEVFQTRDPRQVEEFCRHAGIAVEWRSETTLRTRQVAQAVARHPLTGERVWFNQAHLFHVSALGPAIEEILCREFGEAGLPRNSYYGDGSPIEPEALEQIREAYRQEAIDVPWLRGDVLLLDNMLVAHGRRPFTGARKVVVGMAEPVSLEEL